jgi:hypothetical protein
MAGAAKRKLRSRRAAVAALEAEAAAPAAVAPPCSGAVGDSGCGAAACSPPAPADVGTTWYVAGAMRSAEVGSSARAAVAGDVRGSAVRRWVTPGWRDGGRAWDDSTFDSTAAPACLAVVARAPALAAGEEGRCVASRTAASAMRVAVAVAEPAVRVAVPTAESTAAPAERTVSLTSRSEAAVGGWTAFAAVCAVAVAAAAVSAAPAVAAVAVGAAVGAADPTADAAP